MTDQLKQAALEYHAYPKPGKIGMEITKSVATQADLGLAYTPGVAEPCKAIAETPADAYKYTAKGNLVAVVTNGTAVLGLGNIGPLAAKPVMEGKGVLFKQFADIDVFNIEVDAKSPEHFIEVVEAISPTFGGINLEDIAAPHCFQIEQTLKEKLDIPVFHDDQHGTAIVMAAGMVNALELKGKEIADIKVVCLGAGAAGVACMNLLIALGAQRQNIFMCDRKGVIHSGRDDLNEFKQAFAVETDKRTLADAMDGADILVGVSGPDLVSKEMVATMAPDPIIFAMSNPVPEILPEDAKSVRDDLIMATGRSDFPNQVNNVLCFPFIFRGALDVHSSAINMEMQVACVHAIRNLAKEPVPQEVLDSCALESLEFGPEYIIPKPLDPRLKDVVAPAVARAAIDSGVARADYPEHYPQ